MSEFTYNRTLHPQSNIFMMYMSVHEILLSQLRFMKLSNPKVGGKFRTHMIQRMKLVHRADCNGIYRMI